MVKYHKLSKLLKLCQRSVLIHNIYETTFELKTHVDPNITVRSNSTSQVTMTFKETTYLGDITGPKSTLLEPPILNPA